jgi:gas vesicle protein
VIAFGAQERSLRGAVVGAVVGAVALVLVLVRRRRE